MSEKTKPLTVNELKALAFDIEQLIKQKQQEYNAVVTEISQRIKTEADKKVK